MRLTARLRDHSFVPVRSLAKAAPPIPMSKPSGKSEFHFQSVLIPEATHFDVAIILEGVAQRIAERLTPLRRTNELGRLAREG